MKSKMLRLLRFVFRAPIVILLRLETFHRYSQVYGEFHFNENYRKHTFKGLKSESGILLGEIVVFIRDIKTPINTVFLPGEYNTNKALYKEQFGMDNITTAGLGDDMDHHWNFEERPPELGKFSLIVSQAMLEHLINPYKHICDLADLLEEQGHLIVQSHLPGFIYHRHPVDCLRYYPDWFEEVGDRLNLQVVDKKITNSTIVYKYKKP